MNKNRLLPILLIVGLLAGVTITHGLITYVFHESDPLEITVNPTPTPTPSPTIITTALTANVTTSMFSGNTLLLTAQLSQPLDGVTINFYDSVNGSERMLIGAGATLPNGSISITHSPTVTWPNSEIHTYTAAPQQPE